MKTLLLSLLLVIAPAALAESAPPAPPVGLKEPATAIQRKHADSGLAAPQGGPTEPDALCPAGCSVMHCPPIVGPDVCCKKKKSGYEAC